MEDTVNKRNHIRTVARAGPVWRAVAGATLAVLACAALAGCSKTTKPKDVKYNIYLGASHTPADDLDSSYGRIYVYDADSLNLIDSIFQLGFINDLAVDGRWLYILNGIWGPATLTKMDVGTKAIEWKTSVPYGYPYSHKLNLLRDGELILFGPYVYQTSDGTVVRHLDDSTWQLYDGPPHGTKVAAVFNAPPEGRVNDTILATMDVMTGMTTGRYVPHLIGGGTVNVYTARLLDENRVLLIGIYGGLRYSWFMVGDLTTGHTLYQSRLYSPFGEIAVNSSDSLCIASDPGQPGIWDSPMGADITDLRNMRLLGRINDDGVGQVRFLPSDRRFAATGLSDGWGGSVLSIYSTETWTPVAVINPPAALFLAGGLGVGPRP